MGVQRQNSRRGGDGRQQGVGLGSFILAWFLLTFGIALATAPTFPFLLPIAWMLWTLFFRFGQGLSWRRTLVESSVLGVILAILYWAVLALASR